MTEDTIPESDRIEGAPHPRETPHLLGQGSAESQFLDSYRTARLHHAWLISGPRGVGKATLAWKIARFLLSETGESGDMFGTPALPDTLETSDKTPLAQRLLALSEPRLFLLRRPYDAKTERLKQQITVDETRKLKSFFNLSAADGGRRVVIIDAVDEMNQNAANALLKLLEEPPEGAVLLLISHQPSRLLATIRSRCRELRCHPLNPADLAQALQNTGVTGERSDAPALAALAGGSVGEALRLTNLAGQETYQEILDLFSSRPDLDRARALSLAESAAGRGAAARFELLLHLLDLFLIRLARTGASGPPLIEAGKGEAELLLRMAPGPNAGRLWAETQQLLGARAQHGRAVNLDPAALILDMVLRIDRTAAKCAAC